METGKSSKVFNPHRYQLSKLGTYAVQHGHPWIFRANLSSAIEIFETGQQLSLFDGVNKHRGFGIFDPHGRIGIRVFSFESDQPLSEDFFTKKITKAYQKRLELKLRTDAFRVIHGEADRLPGITLDIYNGHGILQLYSSSLHPWIEIIKTAIEKSMPISSLTLKHPRMVQGDASQRSNRRDSSPAAQNDAYYSDRLAQNDVQYSDGLTQGDVVLFGNRPDVVEINESGDKFLVSLTQGQKGGMFLDLRPVRDLIRKDIRGKKMLNLFCHSGTASVVAKNKGFISTINVDSDENALALAKNMLGEEGNEFISTDIFKNFPQNLNGPFDFILIDPPSLGAKISQLPVIQHAFQKLIQNSLPLLAKKGTIILCSCTRVVTNKHLKSWVETEAKESGVQLTFQNEIPAAEDHPIIPNFLEGAYWSSVRFKKSR